MMLTRLDKNNREILLKSFFFLLLVSIILGMSLEKILVAFGIKNVDPLVSVQIKYSDNIPVWSSFMCGKGFTGMVVETLKRGKPDIATPLPTKYIQNVTTDKLTTGDWTNNSGTWPCFIFNPRKEIFFKPGQVDQIILSGLVDQENDTIQDNLLFGIFDDERNISTVDPFAGQTPSINTFTFTRSERLDVKNQLHSYFFINKQNSVKLPFENKNLAARFLYSPDSYLVLRYTEKKAYTPFDLVSALGGLITYALAIWFILFGRGKYRSWGLVQRYLLRNSPDAIKYDDSNRLLPISYEKSRNQLNNNKSTFVGSQISPSPPPLPGNDVRPSSLFYFSTSGTPTQSKFTNSSSSSSDSVITSPLNSIKELNKRIEAKINQKLWFVEQTLSRHYLSGFKLRRYDVDLKKLGLDTSYDDEERILTPPTAHLNWNNFDSGARSPDNNDKNNKNFQSNDNRYFEKRSNVDNINSLNPEEQKPQYPNVSIGQVPIEKKQRGKSGSYQQEHTSEIGNDNEILSTTTLPSTNYLPPLQIDFNNIQEQIQDPLQHSTSRSSSQIQTPPSLQVGVKSGQGLGQGTSQTRLSSVLSSPQSQVDHVLPQGPEERW